MNAFVRACCVALVFAAGQAGAAMPLPADSIYQLDVRLTSQDGVAAPLAAHRGRPLLVSMFYTSCTMVCPMIVDSLHATRQAVDEPARGRLDVLVVSFDPARDDAAALKRFAQARKLDAKHWTLAYAAPADTRRIAAVLGLQYRQLPDGDFNHSSELVLLDGEGRVAARTDVIGKLDPVFVGAVRKAVSETP